MVFSNLGLPPGAIDVPFVNVSTGAITKYMCVVSGPRTPHTTTAQIDPVDGKLIYPTAPSTLANQSTVIGIAQETIPTGDVGLVRLFGPSFVRVATFTMNPNDTGHTTTVIGVAEGTTAVANIFFYNALTDAMTFTFGSKVQTFATDHAYGWVNTLGVFRLR